MKKFREFLLEFAPMGGDQRNMKGSTDNKSSRFPGYILRSIPPSFIEGEKVFAKEVGVKIEVVNSGGEDNLKIIGDVSKIKKYLKLSGVNSTDAKKWWGI